MTTQTQTIRIVVDKTQATQSLNDLDAELRGMGTAGRAAQGGLNGVSSAAADMARQLGSANDNAVRTTSTVRSMASALAAGSGSMKQAGESAGLAAHHVQNLTFQMNDVATSIASGNGVFRTFAQQGGQIAQIMQQSGLGVKGFAREIAGMLGIIKITKDATLEADAASAAGAAAALRGVEQKAQANILAADTELALANAQMRVAVTAEEQAAAQAAIVGANQRVTAASAEAAVAQEALALAEGEAATAAEAAAAAQVAALGPVAVIAGVVAVALGGLAAMFSNVKNAAGSDAEMKKFAGTLGLTHQEMKKLKDVSITWGDTWNGLMTTIEQKTGFSLGKVGGFFSNMWKKIGDYTFAGIGYLIGGFIGAEKAIAAVANNIQFALGAGFTRGVNLAIDALNGLSEKAFGILKSIVSGMNKAFGTNIQLGNAMKFGHLAEAKGYQDPIAAAKAGMAQGQAMAAGFRSAWVKNTRDAHDDRLRKQAAEIIADRPDKKGPKAKEDPMGKAVEDVAKYQKDLQDSIDLLKEQAAIQQRINDGDQTTYAALAATVAKEIEHKAILDNQAKWGEQWKKLTQDQKDKQDGIAKDLADQKIEADAILAGEKRRGAELEKHKQNQAAIAAAMAGTAAQSSKILADDKARQAAEAETLAIAQAGKDPTSVWAQNRIAAAAAAAREEIATQNILSAIARVTSLRDKFDPQGKLNRDHDQTLNQIAVYSAQKMAAANGDPQQIAAARAEQAQLIAWADKEWKQESTKLAQDTAQKFYDNFSAGISDLAGMFRGKFGDALQSLASIIQNMGDVNKQGGLLGGISKLFGTNMDGSRNPFGEAIDKGFTNFWRKEDGSLKGMSSSFADLKNAFTGPNGSFVKGLGQAIGGAMQGAAIGSAVNTVMKPLGNALGFKTSAMGAQIGGALGSFFGPIGSIVGSIGGSLIGGLFKKTKSGTAKGGIDPFTGALSVSSVTGSGNSEKQAAGQLAQGIADTVNQFVSAVHGLLDPNSRFSLSVKDKKGKFTVNGATFKDEAEAQFYAVKQALSTSLIQVSAFTKKLVGQMTKDNYQSLMGLATSWETMLDDLDSILNPATHGLNDFMQQIDRLRSGMVAAGASTADLAKIEQYRQEKLKQMEDQALSSLQDFRKALFGDGSGVTKTNQLAADLAQFREMEKAIAAGSTTVDQEKFTQLGQEILGLASSVYGGTANPLFQSVRQELIDATNGMIGNVTNAFADTTVTAINQQTDQITQNQVIQNDLLRGILTRLGGSTSSSGSLSAVNGRVSNNLV